MKKGWLLVVVAVSMLVLSACGGSEVDEETSTIYKEKAEEVITLLNEEKTEEISSMLNAEMKAALTEDDLQEVIEIVKASGEFNNIEKSSVEKKDEYYATATSVDYSKENRVYTITFDKNQQIAGLFIK